MLPSEFPRDTRFRAPGPAFVEDGVAHLRRYVDVQRAMTDDSGAEFGTDRSYWAPPGERLHISFYFVWATGKYEADGGTGRHDVLRGLIEPYFRTRAVGAMTAVVQQTVADIVRGIVEKGDGEFDLAVDLAYRVSLRTICALVGLPLDREDWICRQLEDFGRRSDFDLLRGEPTEVNDYFWELVRHRRDNPRDGLLDLLIDAWQRGTINDLELLGYIWGMFSAGTDTTGTAIVNAVSLLDEFGLLDQARLRLDDHAWMRRAEEETLRFATAFPAGPAVTVTDVTLDDGVTLPAGLPVRMWFSAANRDPAINGANAEAPHPDDFHVDRDPNRHMAFGVGTHHCLGARLARLEVHTVLDTLLRKLPGLTLDTDRPFRRYAGLVDGVTTAPFRFDQQAAQQVLDCSEPAEHITG